MCQCLSWHYTWFCVCIDIWHVSLVELTLYVYQCLSWFATCVSVCTDTVPVLVFVLAMYVCQYLCWHCACVIACTTPAEITRNHRDRRNWKMETCLFREERLPPGYRAVESGLIADLTSRRVSLVLFRCRIGIDGLACMYVCATDMSMGRWLLVSGW